MVCDKGRIRDNNEDNLAIGLKILPMNHKGCSLNSYEMKESTPLSVLVLLAVLAVISLVMILFTRTIEQINHPDSYVEETTYENDNNY